jgi:elongation factor Ts
VEIKALDVKKLRDKTGAGMMECKKALVESSGDFAKAEKILKELGLAAAKKVDGRATKEGRIFSKLTPVKAVLVELNCETDFVARNKDFIAVGEKIAETIFEKNLTSITDELNGFVKDIISKIKENMSLRRFKVMEAADDELLVDYIHGEGKIGVIVKVKTGNAQLKTNPKVKEVAFNLALHVAAFAPAYLSSDRIDAGYIQEQEEIFTKQAQATGKPQNVLTGIVKGKMAKHMAEICFLDQNYVKEEKFKVKEILANLGKEVGGKIEVTDYIYMKLGSEG